MEQDANIKAFNYFKKYYSADFDCFNIATGEYSGQWRWKDKQNPIIGVDWLSYGLHAIENTNGLIRQYIPKGTDFSELTDEMLAEIEWKLNHRPRKSLGYRTPLEYCKQ